MPSWNFPGSKWWKFDLHAHTPASLDTSHWQHAIGSESEVTPEIWLAKFVDAGIAVRLRAKKKVQNFQELW